MYAWNANYLQAFTLNYNQEEHQQVIKSEPSNLIPPTHVFNGKSFILRFFV